MKNLSRFVLAILSLCAFVFPVGAGAQAHSPAVRSVTISQGETLWGKWKSTPAEVRLPWEEYWKDASRLSNIPHSDVAWRKLPAGTVVTVPLSNTEIARAKEQEGVLAQAKALVAEQKVADQRIIELKIAEAKLNSDFESLKRALIGALALLLSIVVVIIVMLSRSAKNSRNKVSFQEDSKFTKEAPPPSVTPANTEARMPGLPASHSEAEAMRVAAGVPSTNELTEQGYFLPSDTPYADLSGAGKHVPPYTKEDEARRRDALK